MARLNMSTLTKAARAAFPLTIPIGFAWFFLGVSYGLLMESKGFAVWYTALMAAVIFAGSMEFITADLLLGAFNPLLAFFMALMVNARHLFYGLAMLRKYSGVGVKKWYLVFGLADETFALNSSARIPADVDRGWFYFFTTVINQFYWVASAVCGSLIGSFIPFNTRGIDFILVAMFAAIFLEEWLSTKKHSSAAVGVIVSLVSLLIFGAQAFLIPAMLGILAIFTMLYMKQSGGWQPAQKDSKKNSTTKNMSNSMSTSTSNTED
ncbi:AzlC family ABC transporter permease [Alloscardovia omnicolens]|uniref:AzlC family ABC transporter permease n=1 Tax=Alloscardovia omnicolens TaxID=419015 RepID=UPI003A602470